MAHWQLSGMSGVWLHDFDDRVAVFLRDGHVHARHQREVIGHVAFVAVAEVVAHVLGPHVGFGEQHAVRVVLVDDLADALDDRVRLGKVLVGSALALHQVGNRVEPQPIDALIEPEAHDPRDGVRPARARRA